MSFVKAMVEVDPKKSSNETTNEPRKKQLEEEVMTCYLLENLFPSTSVVSVFYSYCCATYIYIKIMDRTWVISLDTTVIIVTLFLGQSWSKP